MEQGIGDMDGHQMTWIGWGIWMGVVDMDRVADVNGVKS